MPPRKRAALRHGTRPCYAAGCRRKACTDANTRDHKAYLLRKARGEETREDAEPTRQLLRQLSKTMNMTAIAKKTGYGRSYLSRVKNGPNPRTVSKEFAQAIRDLRIYPLTAPTGGVLAVGSQRRIQALESIGQTQGEIALGCGLTRKAVQQISAGTVRGVRQSTHDAIAAYYDANWSRRSTNRHGLGPNDRELPPPGAWDDSTIDDPAAEADWGISDHTLNTLGRLNKTALVLLEQQDCDDAGELRILAAAGATSREAKAWWRRSRSHFYQLCRELEIQFPSLV
jgi:hypothetical protein